MPVKQLGKKAKRIINLSGTPDTNLNVQTLIEMHNTTYSYSNLSCLLPVL